MSGRNHWMITGANRGIGEALVTEATKRGFRVTAVMRGEATSNVGTSVRVIRCDVTSASDVRALANELANESIDVLVNNAGVYGSNSRLGEFDFDDMLATYKINALAPLAITQAALPALTRSPGSRVINVSSMMGSMTDNTSGGAYGYRMSKTALNMATVNLAKDLAPHGILCAAINPGWVQTDMGGRGAPTSVVESAKGIVDRAIALTPEDSGRFLDYRGSAREPLPW